MRDTQTCVLLNHSRLFSPKQTVSMLRGCEGSGVQGLHEGLRHASIPNKRKGFSLDIHLSSVLRNPLNVSSGPDRHDTVSPPESLWGGVERSRSTSPGPCRPSEFQQWTVLLSLRLAAACTAHSQPIPGLHNERGVRCSPTKPQANCHQAGLTKSVPLTFGQRDFSVLGFRFN